MADDFGIEIDDLEFQNVFDAKRLSDVAAAALDRVKDQHEELLNSARAPDGSAMPPLNAKYAARKRDGYTVSRGKNAGKVVAGTGRDKRDLSLSGDMLTSASVHKIPNGAEYGFAPNQVGKARGNEDRSPFHYLSDADIEIAEEAFSVMLDEGLKDVVKIKRRR